MKQNNQTRCGNCILFEYASAEGTGVCAFHQTVITCDAKPCEDFIGKPPAGVSHRNAQNKKNIKQKTTKKIDLLLESAEQVTGKSFTEIKSGKRAEELVFARKAIAFHLQKMGYENQLIANLLGLSRPSISGIKKTHEDEYRFNHKYRKIFDEITKLYNHSLKDLNT
ncbi:MAG: hypothetical protein LBL57_04115 [Tannerella sp.]|jgi:hypothetical protein|nr:hypothetical protein [Tannerella sp.]